MANLCQNMARKAVRGSVNAGIALVAVFLELGILRIAVIPSQKRAHARKVPPAV
ncbi:hypothetical protein [Lelliottia sp.]|uniref:hypothetical protein n=1 Tax=Lelliottia sp. TaxID=1898429 RepID=UPI00388F78A5